MVDSRDTPTSSSPRYPGHSQSSEEVQRGPSAPAPSTSALVLLTDDERSNDDNSLHSPVGFDDADSEDLESPIDSAPPPTSIVPLGSNAAFLYFLSPILKLGAILYSSGQLPYKFTIPALVATALVSAFARHIWFLLARYVRKTQLEDIVQYAFVRDRRHEGLRMTIRSTTSVVVAILHISLASLYLKESVDLLTSYFFETSEWQWEAVFAFLLTSILVPFCLASSLAERRIIFATGASIGLYICWIISLIYAKQQGEQVPSHSHPLPGRLWTELTIIPFMFASPNILLLYGSMIGTVSAAASKDKRFASITLISLLSAVVGLGLVLPVPFLRSIGPEEPQEQAFSLPNVWAAISGAATLTLGIPSLIVSLPTIPLPRYIRRFFKLPSVTRILSLILMLVLSILPSTLSSIISNTVLVLALLGSYFVPALTHIIYHYLCRPLSIIIQPRLTTTGSPSHSPTHDPSTDELLLRKERALQRTRLGRRLFWDMGVWLLLVPVGGGGISWAIGRLIGSW